MSRQEGRVRRARARTDVELIARLAGDPAPLRARAHRRPEGLSLPDHPAADYLRFKQFLAGRELEPGRATSADFYPELLKVFSAVSPLVRFLNASLREKPRGALDERRGLDRRYEK